MMLGRWRRAFHLPWPTPERDVDDELQFHIDQRIADLLASGLSRDQAERQATHDLGDREELRRRLLAIDRRAAGDRRRRDLVESVVAPIQHAARRLVRQPAFFGLTAGSLALALGAATAAAGFADAWMHPVSPFSDPEHVISVLMWGGPDRAHGGMSSLDRWKFIESARSFRTVAFTSPSYTSVHVGEDDFRTQILSVTPNFTAVAGLSPRLGRTFADQGADQDAVIVSDNVWKHYFGDRPTTESASLSVDGRVYDVVGVMPHGSGFPFSADVIRLKNSIELADPGWPVIRLMPDATFESTTAELNAIAARMNVGSADQSRPYGFTVQPLDRGQTMRLTGLHMLLNFIARFILLIACANVSALLLARTAARRRDLALRLALGATRGAIVADVVAELAIIGIVGLAAGLIIANGATGYVRSLIPAELAWQSFVDLRWSWRVVASSAGALLFVLVAAGFLPAIQVSRIPPIEPLKDSSGGATGRSPVRMKSAVMIQLAISLTLLICSSVLTANIAHMSAVDLGFNPRMVTQATGNFVYRGNTEALRGQSPTEFLLPRAAATEGVASVSYYFKGTPDGLQVISDDIGRDAHPVMASQYTIAGPRFLETVGIPLIDGRDFVAGDSVGDGAVILDDSAAKALFPTGSAVGRRIKLGRPTSAAPWRPVIGVARNVAARFPVTRNQIPAIYVATSANGSESAGGMLQRSFAIVARASSPENAVMTSLRLRRSLTSILPTNVQLAVRTMSEDRDAAIASQKQFAALFGSLAAFALAFAAAGLFAVLTFMVRQRMREFGIRVAIGADQRDVAKLVLKDALWLAFGGTMIGGSAGVALALVLWAPQWGEGYIPWYAIAAAEVILVGVVMLAALGPAMRAMKTDPVDVLRAS